MNFLLILSVLSGGAHGGGSDANSTMSEAHLMSCGANFCPAAGGSNLSRPPDHEIFEISAIYLACIVGAVVIIAVFLDPLSRYGERRRGSISATEIGGVQLLSATFNQLKKPNQQLLIPITIFIGMEQAFIGADFTQVSFFLILEIFCFFVLTFASLHYLYIILFCKTKHTNLHMCTQV